MPITFVHFVNTCRSDGREHRDRSFRDTAETTDSKPMGMPISLVTVSVGANEQTAVIVDAADLLPLSYRVTVVSDSPDRVAMGNRGSHEYNRRCAATLVPGKCDRSRQADRQVVPPHPDR